MRAEQHVSSPCPRTVAALTDALTRRDCRVECSFDLHNALPKDAECGCDYAVLLVYEKPRGVGPAVVIAHGWSGSTWLHFRSSGSGVSLTSHLEEALEEVLDATLPCQEAAGSS